MQSLIILKQRAASLGPVLAFDSCLERDRSRAVLPACVITWLRWSVRFAAWCSDSQSVALRTCRWLTANRGGNEQVTLLKRSLASLVSAMLRSLLQWPLPCFLGSHCSHIALHHKHLQLSDDPPSHPNYSRCVLAWLWRKFSNFNGHFC